MKIVLLFLLSLATLQPAGPQKRTPAAYRATIKPQTTTEILPQGAREGRRSASGIIAADAATLIPSGSADRQYWSALAYRMAAPVLQEMSRGELVRDMDPEVAPTWDNRNIRVAYMEAFARLMTGIALWLTLPGVRTVHKIFVKNRFAGYLE